MRAMAAFEHLLKSFDIGDQLDDIASSDPPAYLRRCFAEGVSTPDLSVARVQQLTVCAMVLDSILNDREYANLEPELIADWRAHYAAKCARMKDTAAAALRRALENLRVRDPDAAAELEELQQRLGPARIGDPPA
jgi:hypothetical protein